MRRSLLLVIVGVAMLGVVCPGVSIAQQPPAAQDYAVSSNAFVPGFPYLSFAVDARSGRSGENPSGTARYSLGTPGYNESVDSAAVTCLAVSDNKAVIGGYGLRRIGGYVFMGHPPPPQNTGFFLVVVDNGPYVADPNHIQLGPDQATLVVPTGLTPPTNCSGVSQVSLLPAAGEIVVHDAPALPTSKEQCKLDGYAQFGFNNQGQCVAFVERGPKG